MKISNIYITLLSLFALFSCREEVPTYKQQTSSMDGAQIYIARTSSAQNLTIYPLQDTRETKLSASFGALGLPAKDIQVTFAVNQKAFDSINTARVAAGQTAYEKFPDGSYSFDKLTAVIPAGKLDSDYITLTYKPRAFNKDKTYILPVSITDASGYKISTSKMVVLTVPKFVTPYTVLATTGWTATADSEQDDGSENTGLASAVLDGDIKTIWHTEYWPAEDAYPHWLLIDMKQTNYVGQIGLIKRQGNNNGPNEFFVEGSADSTTWTKMLNKTSMDPTNNSEQKFLLTSPGKYRYLKVTFTSGADFYAFLAEFKAYTTAADYQ